MYSPALGRFLQRDPLGYRGGGENLYRYARSNPAVTGDPSGLESGSVSLNWNEVGMMLHGPPPLPFRVLPLDQAAPANCPGPHMPFPGGGKPPTTAGCKIYQDYCNLGIMWGCNAYWFCMTAGASADINCARACIQSNLPDPGKLRGGPNGTECSNMRDLGFTCECLYYREKACIDACGARDNLPWLPAPSLGAFKLACLQLLGLNVIPIKPGFTVPPVACPTPPEIWCKLE